MSYTFEESISTGIHTRISDTLRISSGWRTYSNDHFSSKAWETFLWNGDRIECDNYPTLKDADSVVNLHCEILDNYKIGKNKKYEENENE